MTHEPSHVDDAPEYVVAHVRQALATDGRVAELGLDVQVEGDTVVVAGLVSTEERRAAIDEVVADAAPGHPVRNTAKVMGYEERPSTETIT